MNLLDDSFINYRKQTMNSDCLSSITQFLAPSEAVRLDVGMAVKNFPKKVKLRDYSEVQKFVSWCRHFDTSNLQEVEYSVFDMVSFRDNMVFGWVPPSVKKLTLRIYNDGVYQIPETVEELCLDHCCADFHLPNSVKRLVLDRRFKGRILTWPVHLEELVIRGWEMDMDGDEPIRLDNLPDSIHTMFLTWGTCVEVRSWPLGLKDLTVETCDDDMIVGWFGIEHAPVPEGVSFRHVEIEPLRPYEDDAEVEWEDNGEPSEW